MSGTIIDGKVQARKIYQTLASRIEAFQRRFGRVPGLAVVQAGEDPASRSYVRNKRNMCKELGIRSFEHDLPGSTPEQELLALVKNLNHNPAVDGILVQLPLPNHVQPEHLLEAVAVDKEVAGFNPYNMGKMLAGHPVFVPATAAGVMELIHSTGVEVAGKRAVVVGRSNIVGKPVALQLLREHATLTLCHSRTHDLAAECRSADILVVAIGRKRCILGDWIKPGAVVIDVGINRDEGGLCGDVAFEEARERAGFITPVPGGVGPMTIAMLMANTMQAAEAREEHQQA